MRLGLAVVPPVPYTEEEKVMDHEGMGPVSEKQETALDRALKPPLPEPRKPAFDIFNPFALAGPFYDIAVEGNLAAWRMALKNVDNQIAALAPWTGVAFIDVQLAALRLTRSRIERYVGQHEGKAE